MSIESVSFSHAKSFSFLRSSGVATGFWGKVVDPAPVNPVQHNKPFILDACLQLGTHFLVIMLYTSSYEAYIIGTPRA